MAGLALPCQRPRPEHGATWNYGIITRYFEVSEKKAASLP